MTPPVIAQRTLASTRVGEATRRLGLGEPILFHSSSAGPSASGRDLSSASGVDRPEVTGPARRIDQPEAEKGGELAPPAEALSTTGLIGLDDLGLGGGAELGGGEPAPGMDPAGSVPVQRGTGGDTSPAPQGLPAVRLIGDPLPAGPQSRDAPLSRVAAPAAAPLAVARLVGDRPAPLAAGVVARPASGGGPVTVARALDPSPAPAPNHTGRASFTAAPASTMDTVQAPVARPPARFEAPVTVQRDGPHGPAVPSITAQAVTVAHAGPAAPDGPVPTAVQRQPGPVSEPTASAPGPAPAAGGEPEELLAKLFDPLLRRLKAELRIDRDRRGSLTDLRL
ncbi:MAG TPA: hypothetical protein VFM37_10630 [Pseudonocardiaceae bacterium]|nr:hypothetical protein [Pseudonocardiaceae bacterium]